MKFDKISMKKSWTSPVLQRLAHDDTRVCEAAAQSPRFAAAAQRLSIKV